MSALSKELIEERAAMFRKIYTLDSPRVDFYWEKIKELFNEVPEFYSYYTAEYAYQQIKMGLWQIWALDDGMIRAIVLTRILIFPICKVFDVMAIAGIGSVQFLPEMEAMFDRLASSAGCSRICCTVRPGMTRKLNKHGGEIRSYNMSRPVAMLQRDQ